MVKKYTLILGASIAVYAALAFAMPSDPLTLAKYQITDGQAKLLALTIFIPLVAIWAAAFYGFVTFKSYAERIKTHPDGQGLMPIANGLGVLALGLPLTTIVSSGLNYLARDNLGLLPVTTNTVNYLSVFITALGFWLMFKGARRLAPIAKVHPTVTSQLVVAGCLALLGAFFAYVLLTQNFATETGRRPYYGPAWVMLVTVVVPYLVAWYAGCMAMWGINVYALHVPGAIYKKALGSLALGIGAVVVGSVVQQWLKMLSDQLVGLSLGPLLALIYALIIVVATGYILVAIGARRLKKIEDA